MADPFIDRVDLGDMLGRDVSADPGALIAIDAACDMVRTLTGQTINRGTTVVTMDGSGSDALLLKERPVNNVGTVVVAGGTISDYVADLERGMVFRKVVSSDYDWWHGVGPEMVKWPAGRQNVVISYDHGFDIDDVPRDIRMVALSIAERLVIQGPAIQETVGDVSVRYAVPQMDLTTTEKMVCDKYRAR